MENALNHFLFKQTWNSLRTGANNVHVMSVKSIFFCVFIGMNVLHLSFTLFLLPLFWSLPFLSVFLFLSIFLSLPAFTFLREFVHLFPFLLVLNCIRYIVGSLIWKPKITFCRIFFPCFSSQFCISVNVEKVIIVWVSFL